MKLKIALFATVLLLSAIVPAQKAKKAVTAAPALPPTLASRVEDALAGFQGKAWIYAKNLDTGKEFALRADEQTRTASTIKLAIMAETFHQVAQGKLNWNDELIITKEKKQGGTGVLSEFSDGTKIDLKTAVNLMIVVSDNTAPISSSTRSAPTTSTILWTAWD
jgi:beta-lactamase class A